jgi:hypothetical protein
MSEDTGQTTAEPLDAPVIQHRIPAAGADPLILAGVNDGHLKSLARLGDCRKLSSAARRWRNA